MLMKKTNIIFLVTILLFTFILPYNVNASELSPNVIRLSGDDRYETSAAISKQGWMKSKYAILARGDSFPDALCASPLAKKYNAPILLTDPDSLSKAVQDEITRLEVNSILIIGGKGAVSEKIEELIKSKGISVERIWGADRYATSVEIAKKIGVNGSVVVTTGENFPDALSISVPAAIKGIPILLSNKTKVPENVKQFLDSNLINKTYLVGGRGVLSDGLIEYLPYPERIGGNDRYETNVAVMKRFLEDINFNNVFLAVGEGPYGNEFADALSGSAIAVGSCSPVVLVNKSLPAPVDYFIRPKMNKNSKVTILGGESVVSLSIADNLLSGTGGIAANVSIDDSTRTIRISENKNITIDTDADVSDIDVYSSNTNVVTASVIGKNVSITGISPGMAVITVSVKKQGFAPGYATFMVTSPVYNANKDSYYDTIQAAIDNSLAGDTIKVASGIYYEHLAINKNNIKIIGESRNDTIIDATQSGNVTKAGIKISGFSGVEIKNMTVCNAGINVYNDSFREPFGIFVMNGSQNVIKNVSLKSNGTYEIYLGDNSSYNTVSDCIIDGLGASGDGYKSLDGIFSCGSEAGYESSGTANSGNKFLNNMIRNVVNGIALTASNNNWIIGNELHAIDSSYWKGYASSGIVISNSSMNMIQENSIDGSQYGLKLSELSSISPYAYAGSPSTNLIRDNKITSTKYGVKIVGTGNIMRGNTVEGSSNNGIWVADNANSNTIEENTISKNKTGLFVENAFNEIHLNLIINNITALNCTSGSLLSADRNWWGSQAGPSGSIAGNVNYSPWAVDSTCTKFNK